MPFSKPPGPVNRGRASCVSAAFSLIEVIVAVAIFALAVVAVLALLPSLSRSASDAADLLAAQRLPDAVRVELQRLAGSGGFDALAQRLPEMAAPLQNGLGFVAARDASQLASADYLPPAAGAQLPPEGQYFQVEVWRFNQPPLRYDPAGSVLPVYVRVSWPLWNPGAAVTPPAARSQFTFVASLHR